MLHIKSLKKFLMTIAVILLFAVLLGLIAFKLAVTDINSAVFTAEPSGTLPADMAKSVITDSEYRLNEGQLNSYAAFLISGVNSVAPKEGRLYVTDVYIDFKSDGNNRCYIRTKRDDFVFSFAADCDIEMENGEIVLTFSNASVGQLPLPDQLLCPVLGRADLGVFDRYLDTSGENPKMRFPTHYRLEVEGWGELVTVEIQSLSITDDNALLTTNPIVGDTISNAAGMIRDKLGDIAGSVISEYPDLSGYADYFN